MSQTSFHTDMGPRENLEDAGRAVVFNDLVPDGPKTTSLVVADGVGGNSFGEVASALVVQALVTFLLAAIAASSGQLLTSGGPDLAVDLLIRGLYRANDLILHRATQDPRLRGMSTTVVCALIIEDILYVAWAGDSRCYLYRNGILTLLTRDHSEIQRLVDAGAIPPEAAYAHPDAHRIYRYVGQSRGFQPDTRICRIHDGDVLLLCTDGLTDVVPDVEIADFISASQNGVLTFDELPQQLVSHALCSGTTDNVTVLCNAYESGSGQSLMNGLTQTDGYPTEMAQAMQLMFREIYDE